MAKKLSKKKNPKSSNKKKSFFDSLLSFRKILVYSIVITVVLFTYNSSLVTSKSVEGASTIEDLQFVTKVQQDSIIKEAVAKGQKATFHQVQVFLDNKKENGKKGDNEDCLGIGIPVTYFVSNGKTTKEITKWACNDNVRLYSKSRTVTVGIRTINGYKSTGLTYTDNNYKNRTIMKISKKEVTGFPSYNAYYTVIDFGVKPK